VRNALAISPKNPEFTKPSPSAVTAHSPPSAGHIAPATVASVKAPPVPARRAATGCFTDAIAGMQQAMDGRAAGPSSSPGKRESARLALTDEFPARVAQPPSLFACDGTVAWQGYGGKEPYLPDVDALGDCVRLRRQLRLFRSFRGPGAKLAGSVPALLKREHRECCNAEILEHHVSACC